MRGVDGARVTGLKTGWTDGAGRCYVTTAAWMVATSAWCCSTRPTRSGRCRRCSERGSLPPEWHPRPIEHRPGPGDGPRELAPDRPTLACRVCVLIGAIATVDYAHIESRLPDVERVDCVPTDADCFTANLQREIARQRGGACRTNTTREPGSTRSRSSRRSRRWPTRSSPGRAGSGCRCSRTSGSQGSGQGSR